MTKKERIKMKPKVAFVCVHNSCRSQIAEASSKRLVSDVFEAYSAGTNTRKNINEDALRIYEDKYGIDMSKTQESKVLSDIPEVDIVITMGCNVDCPHLPCKFREDWGLDDPSGKEDSVFIKTIEIIEEKILQLKHRIQSCEIKL